MSITNRHRKTAWLSTWLLGTACAYDFVQADCQGLPSVSDASTSAAQGTPGQPATVRQAAEAEVHRRQVILQRRREGLRIEPRLLQSLDRAAGTDYFERIRQRYHLA